MDIRQSTLLLSLLAPVSALAAPVANDDTRTVPVGVPITVDVLNNDFDEEGGTLTVIEVTQPETGEATINTDGGITYSPGANPQPGTVILTYTVVNDVEETATGSLTINVVEANMSDIDTGPNESSVARSLDIICSDVANDDLEGASAGRQALAERCAALTALAAEDEDAAREVIQQISPEENLALSKVGSNAAQNQTQMVGMRMMQLGSGISTAGQGGLTWSAGRKGGAAGDGSLMSKFGFFASLQLEDAEKDRTAYEAGFDYSANGVTFGTDYALSTDWFVGGALGLTSNDLDYSNNGGNVSADIYTYIAFSTYHKGNFNLDVQLGGGNSNIDVSRYLNYNVPGYDSVNTQTQGETSGSQWFLSVQGQYMWNRDALTIFPMVKLNYNGSRVKGYADNNAAGWEVVLDDQKVERVIFETGLQATYAINTSWGVMIPNAELNVFADLDTSQDTVTGYFAYAADSSATFAMDAEDPDSMYYQLGVGSSFIFPGGTTGFFGLRQLLGYDDFSSLQFQAGIRTEF